MLSQGPHWPGRKRERPPPPVDTPGVGWGRLGDCRAHDHACGMCMQPTPTPSIVSWVQAQPLAASTHTPVHTPARSPHLQLPPPHAASHTRSRPASRAGGRRDCPGGGHHTGPYSLSPWPLPPTPSQPTPPHPPPPKPHPMSTPLKGRGCSSRPAAAGACPRTAPLRRPSKAPSLARACSRRA